MDLHLKPLRVFNAQSYLHDPTKQLLAKKRYFRIMLMAYRHASGSTHTNHLLFIKEQAAFGSSFGGPGGSREAHYREEFPGVKF